MKLKGILVAVVALSVFARPAWAYLDPASGSLLLQLVLGGVAGLALALKLFWRRIVGFFSFKKPNDEHSAD